MSGSKQPTSETTEWETLIKSYTQHQTDHWRNYIQRHPACEACNPILPAYNSLAFDNFWSWYSDSHNATNYSGETHRRFDALIKTLRTVDPDDRTPSQDQQLEYLVSQLIRSCAYAFSPNYTINDTCVIIL